MNSTVMARVKELAQFRRVFNQLFASFDAVPHSDRKHAFEKEAYGEIAVCEEGRDARRSPLSIATFWARVRPIQTTLNMPIK